MIIILFALIAVSIVLSRVLIHPDGWRRFLTKGRLCRLRALLVLRELFSFLQILSTLSEILLQGLGVKGLETFFSMKFQIVCFFACLRLIFDYLQGEGGGVAAEEFVLKVSESERIGFFFLREFFWGQKLRSRLQDLAYLYDQSQQIKALISRENQNNYSITHHKKSTFGQTFCQKTKFTFMDQYLTYFIYYDSQFHSNSSKLLKVHQTYNQSSRGHPRLSSSHEWLLFTPIYLSKQSERYSKLYTIY